MLYAIVALLVIVLDQWTKLWVATNKDMFPRPLIDGFISLVTAQNKGIAFGLFGGETGSVEGKTATVIFIAVAGVVALLAIILLATNLVKGGLGRWSLVFIAAGGLSNAIDRLLNDGAVLDMIKLDFLQKININFPIFNVADIFITVFSILLILYVLFGGRRKDDDEDEEEDEEEEDEPEEELEDEEKEDLPRRKGKTPRRSEPEPEPEQPRKKTRQSYEEEYERYKARKAQEEQSAPKAEPAAPAVDPEDPFAEWERANQKVGRAKPAAPAEVKPEPAPAADAPAPAPKPRTETPKPAPAPASEEFSLDDILAEFK